MSDTDDHPRCAAAEARAGAVGDLPAIGCAIIAAKAPMVDTIARFATLFASSRPATCAAAGCRERAPDHEDAEVGGDDPPEAAHALDRRGRILVAGASSRFVEAIGFEVGAGADAVVMWVFFEDLDAESPKPYNAQEFRSNPSFPVPFRYVAPRGSYAKGITKHDEILTTALDVIARNDIDAPRCAS